MSLHTEPLPIEDKEIQIIRLEKESAMKYRERRHSDWNDNYTLYRDKVITNRLTQRQTINIPLMKYAINTLLKNLNETPSLYFPNLDNKHQQEVYYNEYWKEMSNRNNIEIKDVVDKKMGVLFGRPFKKINIENGKVTFEIVDSQDMLVHRFVDPSEFHNARCVIQTGIFRPLVEILENDEYFAEGRGQLRAYFNTESGNLESETNLEEVYEREQRMQTMGVQDALDPVLGETYVELNEVYRYEWSDKKKDTVIFRYVVAATDNGYYKLHKAELCDLIGATSDNFWYNHFPFETWACDPERTDFWSDGIADIIRPINRVLNSWISQLVENRTLRNFGMNYYDSSDASFVPQTYTPQPWGWYPVGGNPNEKIKTVDIPELTGSLEEIQFLINIAEKATAATSTQTGTVESRQVTLGEVQLALANAEERIQSVAKYINNSWKNFGMLYVKMLEASYGSLDETTIYRRGRQSRKIYTQKISPKDWLTKSGYSVEIKTEADKEAQDVDMLQKLNAAKTAMPANVPLNTIYNRKLLEFAGLTPEEVNEVEQFERQDVIPQAGEENGMMGAEGQAGQGVAQPIPNVPDIVPVTANA